MSSSEYLYKENYKTTKKRKWKRKMNKGPNLAAPVLHAWIPGPSNDGQHAWLVSSLFPTVSLGQAWNDGTLGRLQALKTGISRGNFPEQIRDPLIRSGNHSNRFRHQIRRIFPDFFPNPFFPKKMISGREFRYSVSVGTGISRSCFHPYLWWYTT